MVVKYDTEEVKNPDDAKESDGGEKQPEKPTDSVLRKVVDFGKDFIKGLFK